jgi:hypothetical protein
MVKFRDFIDILINPIWKWGVEIFMGLLSVIIYIKPEWTTWLSFSNLIIKYWWIWFVFGTIIWAFSTAWQYTKEKAEMRKAIEVAEKSSETYQIETGVGKQSANEIKNYFGDATLSEVKKKDELERLSKPKIDFSPRWKHFDDIVITGSEPKQIMTVIKADGMGAWFIHLVVDKVSYKLAYDIDYEETSFYEPEKDNTLLYGGIFSTIQYRLGTKKDGRLTKTQIGKMHEMFFISIIHIGSGDTARSTVRFDTNYPDAIGFYDRLKEGLNKQGNLAEKKKSIEKELAEKEVVTDRWREAAMQSYLDKITELILEKDLLLSKQNEGVRHLARARTLTIIPTLNQERQRTLLRFLYEAKLIEKDDPIIDFTNIDLSGADLGFFLLRGANLKRVNLRKADIRGADLFSSNFRMAIFEDAILAMTNFQMANLQQANFIKADLVKAQLNGADLTGANFIRANLKSTNLNAAILNGVNLTLANLEKANLKGVIIDNKMIVCDTVMPDGSIANSVEEFKKFI